MPQAAPPGARRPEPSGPGGMTRGPAFAPSQPLLPGPPRRVGPPVMFVVEVLNVSEASPDVNRTCSVAGCDPGSLLNQARGGAGARPGSRPAVKERAPPQRHSDSQQAGAEGPLPPPLPTTCRAPPAAAAQVSAASRAPWASWLATPAASWLDDFLAWASPDIPQCCRAFTNGTRCPPPDQPPCAGPAPPEACGECAACFAPGELPGGRPSLQQFQVWAGPGGGLGACVGR